MNITTEQPEALRLARELEGVYPVNIQDQEAAAAELRRLHAENQQLRADLEAVGAGGVGPLITTTVQHQHKLSNDNDLQHENGHLITSSSTAPAGWKLVPVEPTMSMQHAALIESRAHGPVSTGECNALPISYELWASAMVYRAMLAAAPQPQVEQEPLFWYRPRSDGMYEGPLHNAQIEHVRKESGGWVPLYTRPHPRQPLTDEQIDAVWGATKGPRHGIHRFARAIERAHGIGS